MRRLGLRVEELAALKKSDERKAAPAAYIRTRTAVSNQWIAQTLCLGQVSRVNQCARKAPTELLERPSAVPGGRARL